MARTIVIIGGGVVGLNIALAVSERKLGDVFLLEKEPYLGHHTSTRNSEVVHAGFAYSPGSLKSTFCVEGNSLTYRLLDSLGVKCRRGGKWIVAYTDDEVAAIENIVKNASACGVRGMRRADPAEVLECSPLVARPKAALFSETSGIMDASGYMKALERALAMRDGVFLVYPCEVCGIDARRKTFTTTKRGDMNYDILINAAGLFSDDIYRMAGGRRQLEIIPYKGEYYTWRHGGIEGLIYPVPRAFLPKSDATLASNFGIHLHRTIGGELMVGPSQIKKGVADKEDYAIETPPEAFIEEVSPLVTERPGAEDLAPALAGNRPKLFEDGRAVADFEIFRDGDVIHLLGIESPGLTAAPAIARYVAGLI